MRKSNIYWSLIGFGGVVLAFLLFIHPLFALENHREAQEKRRSVVRELQLTDFCLFCEARYTRHLSQADLYSAFQDHPLAFEHFPSGSLAKPPEHLLRK